MSSRSSIVLVHGLDDRQDDTWTSAVMLVIQTMHHKSRIRSWKYDESKLSCDALEAEENLNIEVNMLMNAVEEDQHNVPLSPSLHETRHIVTDISDAPRINNNYGL